MTGKEVRFFCLVILCKKMDQLRMSKITETKKLAGVRMKGLGEGEANKLGL